VLLDCPSERGFLRPARRPLGHLFPYIPGQSGFNKRLRTGPRLSRKDARTDRRRVTLRERVLEIMAEPPVARGVHKLGRTCGNVNLQARPNLCTPQGQERHVPRSPDWSTSALSAIAAVARSDPSSLDMWTHQAAAKPARAQSIGRLGRVRSASGALERPDPGAYVMVAEQLGRGSAGHACAAVGFELPP